MVPDSKITTSSWIITEISLCEIHFFHSTFLQIPLEESSRIWTAFHFEGQTCQFGFRNSFASFIKALQLVLGSDSKGYVLNYVDITVHSNTCEHIKHLNALLGKLTTACVTINIDECDFCKQEKNLSHVICDKQVKVDPEWIAAILNYPAPRNTKVTISANLLLSPPIYHKLCRLRCAIIRIAQKRN